MKKIINVLVLCMLATVFSGCARYTCDMKISGGGKVEINEVVAYNSDVIQKISPELEDTINKNLEKESAYLKKWDYKIDEYYESPFNGILIRKKIPNMNAFKMENMPYGFVSKHAVPILVTKSFLKNKYELDWRFNSANMRFRDPQAEVETSGRSSKSSKKSGSLVYLDEFIQNSQEGGAQIDPSTSELELSIKLPARSLDDNAKDAVGTTYYWTLPADSEAIVHIVWQATNFGNIAGVIIFIIIFILIILQMLNPNKVVKNSEL